MRRMTALPALLIAVTVLAGCAAGFSPDPDLPSAPPERTAEESPAPSPTVPADEAEAAGPDDAEPDEEAPDEPIYHMNKAYFIKPNDEDGNKHVVLLTFDDGPKELELLTGMLDTLDKHEAKAIFFVNGYRVKRNPDLLKLIDERGQTIGNHSWDHINLKNESPEKIDQQLEDVQAEVERLIGKKPEFFRPPNGAGNDYLRSKAKELGMLYMTWSNGSLDWADNRNNPDGVIRSVMDQLAPGSNILMHELPWTAEALDRLLTLIAEAGYAFVDPQAIEREAR